MATTAQIIGGYVGQASIKFEDVVAKNKNGKKPKDQKDIWGERKTKSKTDVLNSEYNYSVKNPESSSQSTQIQVCTVERFCKLFNVTGELKVKFDQFFGNNPEFFKGPKYKQLFENHCRNVWNIDPSTLDPQKEVRRNRLLFSSIQNNKELLDWFQNNIQSVLKFVFKTSFNDPKNTDLIANRILWVKEKNNYGSRVEIDIDPLIKNIVSKSGVSIRDHKKHGQSVIEIGPVTLQMKGSGTGKAYHHMQFNASLNDILKFK